MAEPTSSLERTLSRESTDEPLFAASAAPTVATAKAQQDGHGADPSSPRACGSSPGLRKLEEKMEAAASRREDSLAALTKRCGQQVQRARYDRCAPP